jgi:spore germination cell wall hydrolase CwlJ-like protein
MFGIDDGILPPSAFEHRDAVKLAALPSAATESVAPKGLVTGEERRPKSPAEQLGLIGPARAKAEKCLADAIYFESRGEVEKGQVAVAQVVINRAFSGYYPQNVCGVVYQNAHRHLACQFTFACDGIKDVVTEPDMWEQAKRIARDMLDGKLWLSEVGKATHYHAFWVRPNWIREMRKIQRIGVHTFYRPRAWEDG